MWAMWRTPTRTPQTPPRSPAPRAGSRSPAPFGDWQGKYDEVYRIMQKLAQDFTTEKRSLERRLECEKAVHASGAELASLRQRIADWDAEYEEHARVLEYNKRLEDRVKFLTGDTKLASAEDDIAAQLSLLKLRYSQLEEAYHKARGEELAKVVAMIRGSAVPQGAEFVGEGELEAANLQIERLMQELEDARRTSRGFAVEEYTKVKDDNERLRSENAALRNQLAKRQRGSGSDEFLSCQGECPEERAARKDAQCAPPDAELQALRAELAACKRQLAEGRPGDDDLGKLHHANGELRKELSESKTAAEQKLAQAEADLRAANAALEEARSAAKEQPQEGLQFQDRCGVWVVRSSEAPEERPDCPWDVHFRAEDDDERSLEQRARDAHVAFVHALEAKDAAERKLERYANREAAAAAEAKAEGREEGRAEGRAEGQRAAADQVRAAREEAERLREEGEQVKQQIEELSTELKKSQLARKGLREELNLMQSECNRQRQKRMECHRAITQLGIQMKAPSMAAPQHHRKRMQAEPPAPEAADDDDEDMQPTQLLRDSEDDTHQASAGPPGRGRVLTREQRMQREERERQAFAEREARQRELREQKERERAERAREAKEREARLKEKREQEQRERDAKIKEQREREAKIKEQQAKVSAQRARSARKRQRGEEEGGFEGPQRRRRRQVQMAEEEHPTAQRAAPAPAAAARPTPQAVKPSLPRSASNRNRAVIDDDSSDDI
eukprot:TRINITY_DN369_c0_g2_i1.p1 TRINITY_DN369_c0_g2~~TRINITY_DN369_c0_g2_i1.p1  ORF type:complete len:771 (+),score=353.40 TRINITY_DN369_c0_g2_i1:114-2315(+)